MIANDYSKKDGSYLCKRAKPGVGNTEIGQNSVNSVWDHLHTRRSITAETIGRTPTLAQAQICV